MRRVYTGKNLREISFPLGGIGSGSIGLSGNGRLIDWEIFNRPNKQSVNGYTNFAIKAESAGKVLDARLLQGDTTGDFTGGMHTGYHSWGYGHGPSRTTLAGLKHFADTQFYGEYPIAEICFSDHDFPGRVRMSAFNPFIPVNDKDSSLPAAFFEFEIDNDSEMDIDYTIAFSVYNPLHKRTVNTFVDSKTSKAIYMTSKSRTFTGRGNATVSTDAKEVSYQEYWYRSGWFDDVTTFWREFSQPGKLVNRHYDKTGTSDIGNGDMCTLAAHISVKAGEKGKIRFLLSWYFPIFEKYWASGIEKFLSRLFGFLPGKNKTFWKNYYATLFGSSKEVSDYCLKNWNKLFKYTKLFKDALFGSSLPAEVVDAVQGNIATLKTTTCMRLEDGSFYAFEGSNKTSGSCEGTCDHVWGYAYALPFLFPELERSIREITYTYNLKKSGAVAFRTMLPLGRPSWIFHPCVDGQFGNIMKFYRDWKICGDDRFLKRHWSALKKSLEYAWSPKNKYRWDPDKRGVIAGRQHHTLDVELFGANSWLSGYYIGALQAAAEMADHLGENEKASEYRGIAERGKKYVENKLFNGSHYIQEIDLSDKSVTDKFGCSSYYWNYETRELKYQIKDGCEIDQVVAQWHAKLIGLKDIFDEKHCRQALQSVYRLNFKSMRDVSNPCRIFALDDERGVVICEWGKGAYKPKIPIPYTEETMTGFEYAVACNMLLHGMEKEALEIVRAVRERYDGYKRNPWAEIECGSSYARAMSSYSFLLAYSGFSFDMTERRIGFDPIHWEKGYNTFWSVDGAFGSFSFDGKTIRLKVLYGSVYLKELGLPKNVMKIKDCNLPFEFNNGTLYVKFKANEGDELCVITEEEKNDEI